MSPVVSTDAFLGKTLQPYEWRYRAQTHIFYIVSCFTPLLIAYGVYLFQRQLTLTCPLFPWQTLQVTLVIQGGLTFVGDVVTFGSDSLWKAADVWLATLHTTVYVLFATFPTTGLATWPWTVALSQLLAATVALYCKRMGVKALKCRDANAFFWHHSMWHYFIGVGARISLYFIAQHDVTLSSASPDTFFLKE